VQSELPFFGSEMIFKLELVCRVYPHLPVELAWIVSKTLEKAEPRQQTRLRRFADPKYSAGM